MISLDQLEARIEYFGHVISSLSTNQRPELLMSVTFHFPPQASVPQSCSDRHQVIHVKINCKKQLHQKLKKKLKTKNFIVLWPTTLCVSHISKSNRYNISIDSNSDMTCDGTSLLTFSLGFESLWKLKMHCL